MPEMPSTCVEPPGLFVWAVHTPSYHVANLRQADFPKILGRTAKGQSVDNRRNFPAGDLIIKNGDPVYEIRNQFSFWGATYIAKSYADHHARHPEQIAIPQSLKLSFGDFIKKWAPAANKDPEKLSDILADLPDAIKMTLAINGTEPEELACLADFSAEFEYDAANRQPIGLHYAKDFRGRLRPVIKNRNLFEALANNIHLPDIYKAHMALIPGAQGQSAIMGDWSAPDNDSRVFEYLRQNSYIPWGHYAANMAHDSIRYHIFDLSEQDLSGMRHLYYQRTYLRIANELRLPEAESPQFLDAEKLENLRIKIQQRLSDENLPPLKFNSTLWGWNYGFDVSPSGYRLHASHQQIHQQYALIPKTVEISAPANQDADRVSAFACGDLVADFTKQFQAACGHRFFACLLEAIYNNRRTDGDPTGPQSLTVYEDENVLLFVPKAQTSQWELQLMPTTGVGNILEADQNVRNSLDYAMLAAVKVLAQMGARMITCIEFSKRFDAENNDQHLLYCFLPRLPKSPGAFSETQLRWINRHYPEDFAWVCRTALSRLEKKD